VRPQRVLLCLALALASSSVTWSAPPPSILIPEGTLPPILAEVELGPDVRAIDVTSDGRVAALATSTGERKHARSTVRLIAMEQAEREIELSGFVRDLLFSPGGEELLLIQLRPATKRRSVENYLLRLDLTTFKIRRELYLPATSRSLAHWPRRNAILVACSNELRTFLLPDMRSGPLYRIPGENHSVAVIDGSQVAIGQTDRMLVIDLSDPPGREEMPTRDAIDVPSAVVDLAFAPGGAHGLARLEDDRVVRVRTQPLSIELESPPTAPLPEPEPVEVEAPVVAAAPPPEDVAPPPPVPDPEPVEVEAPVVATAEPPQARGAISGPGLKGVVAIVFFGPDNILHEATRVAPEPDGSWRVDGLAEGRYRVVLDGGGGRVLLTDPRFHVVDVKTGIPPLTVDFEILRSM
jgi:hypothetical protein